MHYFKKQQNTRKNRQIKMTSNNDKNNNSVKKQIDKLFQLGIYINEVRQIKTKMNK